ncbi:MAG TPA: hypothetical protein PLR53_01135, partial [Bacteroidales bacterium]|nr:hypothetical protein [Bacteroidales bacterium]
IGIGKGIEKEKEKEKEKETKIAEHTKLIYYGNDTGFDKLSPVWPPIIHRSSSTPSGCIEITDLSNYLIKICGYNSSLGTFRYFSMRLS